MPERIRSTLYTDAGCPWAYSAIPALRVLEWRYGDQLDWRLVTIGLTEDAQQYVDRGYTPLRSARGQARFRRYGMPFAPNPKARVSATARACRAIHAARALEPGAEWRALRALQLAQFTTPLVLDDDEQVARVAAAGAGLDAGALEALLDDAAVDEAYGRDRAEARTAAGTPTELQGKTAQTDGPVRYTAPSLVFERGDTRLEAGGWQPAEAYDVVVANVDPTLRRRPAAEDPADVVAAFPEGVTTQEVAAVMTQGNDDPDRERAEHDLLAVVADGAAVRIPLGDDAIWADPTHADTIRAVLREAGAAEPLAAAGR